MTRSYHSPTPHFEMAALRRMLPPASFARLERLAELDDRYLPQLLLLELAATALLDVAAAAEVLPLEGYEDLPQFVLNGLDQAALHVGIRLREMWPEVEERGALLGFLEENDYHMSDDYLQRTTRFALLGRMGLLQRIMIRVARQWMARKR